MSGPNPKHGRAVEDTEDETLVASGPAPKHGVAAALAVGATPEREPAVEPDSGLQGTDV